MKNTARRPEPEVTFATLLQAGLAGAGMAIVRNPVAVGGATAFAVAFSFVSANALWYQPHFHSSALISTRAPVFTEPTPQPAFQRPAPVERTPVQVTPDDDTTGAIPPQRPDPAALGDPTIRKVQTVLQELGLYRGGIDGLQGPATRTAIENYRRIVGLNPGAAVDEALLRQLGLSNVPAEPEKPSVREALPEPGAAPTPTPRPAYQARSEAPLPAAPVPGQQEVPLPRAEVREPIVQSAAVNVPEADPMIMRVQAGLKAFGNDGINVDGVLGENTRAAIREFQSLFGLPVSGQPDAPFLAKMREVGLTN
ncbi:peptidoglycan-binding protein [Nitratireductor sp. GISD-1A_MAKvit]|uniref:peptidoglycan-binding domain-containing protein n=1 Tax=Nitratireductor sp. GISD-1A_MAKvit TaxID=3234198 RepID=UPI003466DAA0